MNLECLNGIITDNLAIHIDLTSVNSWDLNTGFTSFSLTKWSGAIVDNINLLDFGLTGFDNGRTNLMWGGLEITTSDDKFSMYRVGYNEVTNPTTGETSGVTATTRYDTYPMSAITSGTSGNYFELNGGYLQGFFKLDGYNYELFPARSNEGVTIETLLYLYPESHGIFFMMGARAEDKYNPFFSGETTTGKTVTGVNTSLNNYLDALEPHEVTKKAFIDPQDNKNIIHSETTPVNNIKNNAIAFEITQDKKLAYKYVDKNGLIVTNSSTALINATGFTMISVAFTPNTSIDDPDLLICAAQRTGKMIFYVNGRPIWILHDFPEFYFKGFDNDKEKQLGVPYSISWGGGSFGLEHSWHYDYQEYLIYKGGDDAYINSKFYVQGNPLPTECFPNPTDLPLEGLSLSADSTSFQIQDDCNPELNHPLTVMRIEYTGDTEITGTSANTYFIKFNQPISVLSNRDYEVNLSIFDDGFFRSLNPNGGQNSNKISILVYSDTTDVSVVDETEYTYPLRLADIENLETIGLHPFPDRQEYMYELNGILYYGGTGIPILDYQTFLYGGKSYQLNLSNIINGAYVTGQNTWKPLKNVFRVEENTGKQEVNIGLLIQTDYTFNVNKPLFVTNFTYTGADILVQDDKKDNLLIQQNFDSAFLGGIQKLRLYDKALTSSEILYNALEEAKSKPNMLISKGGRIIYR